MTVHPLNLPDHVVNPDWPDSTSWNSNKAESDFPVTYTHTRLIDTVQVTGDDEISVHVEQDVHLSWLNAIADDPAVHIYGSIEEGGPLPAGAASRLGAALIAAESMVDRLIEEAVDALNQTTPEN